MSLGAACPTLSHTHTHRLTTVTKATLTTAQDSATLLLAATDSGLLLSYRLCDGAASEDLVAEEQPKAKQPEPEPAATEDPNAASGDPAAASGDPNMRSGDADLKFGDSRVRFGDPPAGSGARYGSPRADGLPQPSDTSSRIAESPSGSDRPEDSECVCARSEAEEPAVESADAGESHGTGALDGTGECLRVPGPRLEWLTALKWNKAISNITLVPSAYTYMCSTSPYVALVEQTVGSSSRWGSRGSTRPSSLRDVASRASGPQSRVPSLSQREEATRSEAPRSEARGSDARGSEAGESSEGGGRASEPPEPAVSDAFGSEVFVPEELSSEGFDSQAFAAETTTGLGDMRPSDVLVSLVSLDDGRCFSSFMLDGPTVPLPPPRTARETELASRLVVYFDSPHMFVLWDMVSAQAVLRIYYHGADPPLAADPSLAADDSLVSATAWQKETTSETDLRSTSDRSRLEGAAYKEMVGRPVAACAIFPGPSLAVFTEDGQLHLWDFGVGVYDHWSRSELVGQATWVEARAPVAARRFGLSDVWHAGDQERDARIFPGFVNSQFVLVLHERVLLFHVRDHKLHLLHDWHATGLRVRHALKCHALRAHTEPPQQTALATPDLVSADLSDASGMGGVSGAEGVNGAGGADAQEPSRNAQEQSASVREPSASPRSRAALGDQAAKDRVLQTRVAYGASLRGSERSLMVQTAARTLVLTLDGKCYWVDEGTLQGLPAVALACLPDAEFARNSHSVPVPATPRRMGKWLRTAADHTGSQTAGVVDSALAGSPAGGPGDGPGDGKGAGLEERKFTLVQLRSWKHRLLIYQTAATGALATKPELPATESTVVGSRTVSRVSVLQRMASHRIASHWIAHRWTTNPDAANQNADRNTTSHNASQDAANPDANQDASNRNESRASQSRLSQSRLSRATRPKVFLGASTRRISSSISGSCPYLASDVCYLGTSVVACFGMSQNEIVFRKLRPKGAEDLVSSGPVSNASIEGYGAVEPGSTADDTAGRRESDTRGLLEAHSTTKCGPIDDEDQSSHQSKLTDDQTVRRGRLDGELSNGLGNGLSNGLSNCLSNGISNGLSNGSDESMEPDPGVRSVGVGKDRRRLRQIARSRRNFETQDRYGRALGGSLDGRPLGGGSLMAGGSLAGGSLAGATAYGIYRRRSTMGMDGGTHTAKRVSSARRTPSGRVKQLWEEGSWVCEEARIPSAAPATSMLCLKEEGVLVAGFDDGYLAVYSLSSLNEIIRKPLQDTLHNRRTWAAHMTMDGGFQPIVHLIPVTILLDKGSAVSESLFLAGTCLGEYVLCEVVHRSLNNTASLGTAFLGPGDSFEDAPHPSVRLHILLALGHRFSSNLEAVVYSPWAKTLYTSDRAGFAHVFDGFNGARLGCLDSSTTYITISRWQNQLQIWRARLEASSATSDFNRTPKSIASNLGLDICWINGISACQKMSWSGQNRLLTFAGLKDLKIPCENYLRTSNVLQLSTSEMLTAAIILGCFFPWDGSVKDLATLSKLGENSRITIPQVYRLFPLSLIFVSYPGGSTTVHSLLRVPGTDPVKYSAQMLSNGTEGLWSPSEAGTSSPPEAGMSVLSGASLPTPGASRHFPAAVVPAPVPELAFPRPEPSSLWILTRQVVCADVVWAWQTHLLTSEDDEGKEKWLQAEVRRCRQYLYRCLLHNTKRYRRLRGLGTAPTHSVMMLASHKLVSSRNAYSRTTANEILKQTALRSARALEDPELLMTMKACLAVLRAALVRSNKPSSTLDDGLVHARNRSGGDNPRSASLPTNRSAPDLRQFAQFRGFWIKPLCPGLPKPLLASSSSFLNNQATLCESCFYTLLILNYYVESAEAGSHKPRHRLDTQPSRGEGGQRLEPRRSVGKVLVDGRALADKLMLQTRHVLGECTLRVLAGPLSFYRWLNSWTSTGTPGDRMETKVRKAVTDPFVRFKLQVLLDTLEAHGRRWRQLWFADPHLVIRRCFVEPSPLALKARALEVEMVKTLRTQNRLELLRGRYDATLDADPAATDPVLAQAATENAENAALFQYTNYNVWLHFCVDENLAPMITSLLYQCTQLAPLKLIALTSTLINLGNPNVDCFKCCIRCLGKLAFK
ncbi:hypothetical protein GNI_138890 [Gregarina niphandrodes]|uniref:Uncharacterized protein n=1 Tax=Gregarina niphandrodes TaxID=110365 RepID=A0A023B0K4_GRENI|nr:hypothetical protein GNI_138890 [Gregarina niphandrodes]EZG45375.1 hypothetical protein GNI_138890 [Gregarina niphandrodes]|eukprot:XP_011132512.1 hypothetical protein GNI_138890 [Gregarina niphandrodes]